MVVTTRIGRRRLRLVRLVTSPVATADTAYVGSSAA
jgi:hypothetical protein